MLSFSINNLLQYFRTQMIESMDAEAGMLRNHIYKEGIAVV